MFAVVCAVNSLTYQTQANVEEPKKSSKIQPEITASEKPIPTQYLETPQTNLLSGNLGRNRFPSNVIPNSAKYLDTKCIKSSKNRLENRLPHHTYSKWTSPMNALRSKCLFFGFFISEICMLTAGWVIRSNHERCPLVVYAHHPAQFREGW